MEGHAGSLALKLSGYVCVYVSPLHHKEQMGYSLCILNSTCNATLPASESIMCMVLLIRIALSNSQNTIFSPLNLICELEVLGNGLWLEMNAELLVLAPVSSWGFMMAIA